MDIQARMDATKQKFDKLEIERQRYLKQAEEAMVELTKLMGEYRVLETMQEEARLEKLMEREAAEPTSRRRRSRASTIEVQPDPTQGDINGEEVRV